MNLSIADLQALALSVGVPPAEVPTAAAIAMAESSGNPRAVGDLNVGGSYGLWQINRAAHPQYDEQDLFDPTYNAKAMLAVSNGGSNWGPWSTWWVKPPTRTSAGVGPGAGVYRKYLRPFAPSSVAPASLAKPLLLASGILVGGLGLAYAIHERPRARSNPIGAPFVQIALGSLLAASVWEGVRHVRTRLDKRALTR